MGAMGAMGGFGGMMGDFSGMDMRRTVPGFSDLEDWDDLEELLNQMFNIIGRGGMGRMPGMSSSTNIDSESMKGIKARTRLTITGGDFVIDAEDDAIHSDGDLFISGGTFEIRTGDDAFKANRNVVITEGDINVLYSYEGIDGMTITIHGGNINIFATDDGISDSGLPPRSVNVGNWIRITGGNIHIHSYGDGIDSNGNAFIEGGTIMISAPSMMMEGAIACNGSVTITGGELITAGSIMGVSRNSTQPVIELSYTQQQPEGTVIAIKDTNDTILLEYTSLIAFSMSGFTSPAFEIGEMYMLYINGEKRTDIELTGIITSIGDDGGAYSGGRGFGPGAMPGRRR
jgi:hypothetical protein